MHDGLLLSGGACRNSSLAAVIADAIDRRTIVDDRSVVDVVNRGDIYIGDRAIVEEPPIVPTSAFEAFSGITKTIVDAAIETDMGAPIAVIENITSFVPGPVWWSPEIAGLQGPIPRCLEPSNSRLRHHSTPNSLASKCNPRRGREAARRREALAGRNSPKSEIAVRTKQKQMTSRTQRMQTVPHGCSECAFVFSCRFSSAPSAHCGGPRIRWLPSALRESLGPCTRRPV